MALEISYTCPLCSRIFLADRGLVGALPGHLDALLGHPCQASGWTVKAFLDHHLADLADDPSVSHPTMRSRRGRRPWPGDPVQADRPSR